MPVTRFGKALWPGIRQPKFCTYTLSQGVSPGVAVFRCVPQPGIPFAPRGDLVLFDGESRITLRDCKVDKFRELRAADGITWELTVLDRRWKWRDCFFVNLFANQLDPHGKFIGWTIRSPKEVAEICLRALGESRFTIDLPEGLTRADGAGVKEFLRTGLNFPPSGVNPPLDWYFTKPAGALASFCEQFGCIVCYSWKLDGVVVAQKGSGAALPDGSVWTRTPTVDDPETPDGVKVVGSPTRYQIDLELQAFGEEHDGSYKPVNSLSYAPLGRGTKHRVEYTGTFEPDFKYYVVVGDTEIGFTAQTAGTDPDFDAVLTSLLAAVTAAIAANPRTAGKFTAFIEAGKLVIEAVQTGAPFDARSRIQYAIDPVPDPPPVEPVWGCKIKRVGAPGAPTWEFSPPPLFPGIRATPDLTLAQARDKARKSVWQYYGLTGRDVSKRGPINVPGYGLLARKQQLILLNEMCEQVVPSEPDFAVRLKDGSPLVRNLYDGYSRSVPARCYGAVAKTLVSHLYYVQNKSGGLNTAKTEEVQIDFSIDPVFQLVKFAGHVFKRGDGGRIVEPDLRLRTAVHVRNAETNQTETFEKDFMFPGSEGKAVTVERHDDVQLNVIPEYDDMGRVRSVRALEVDPDLRAQYYLEGLVRQYQVKASLNNGYNGLEEIDVDGAISQVTWTVGESERGAITEASINFEHNTAVVPYPARRRAENLRAVVGPGGFLGQTEGRKDPTRPPPFTARGG